MVSGDRVERLADGAELALLDDRFKQQFVSQTLNILGRQIALDQKPVAGGQAQIVDLQQVGAVERFVGQQVWIAGQRRDLDLPDLGCAAGEKLPNLGLGKI